jgi:membrane protease YdiL (CAAX protease family)
MAVAVIIIGTLGLVVAYVVTIKRSVREHLGGWLAQRPVRIWLLPGSVLAYYTVVASAGGRWSFNGLAVLALYLGVPTLLAYLTGPKFDEPMSGRDLAINFSILLWIWLPIEVNVVPIKWFHVSIGDGTPRPFPLGTYAVVIYSLIVLSGWRRFDMNCDLSFKKSYLVPIVTTFEVLSVILLLMTLPSGLVHAGMANFTKLNTIGLPLEVALPFTVVIGIPAVLFGLTLVEELIFRGGIQNLLGQRLHPLIALLIASVVFGLAHINNTAFGLAFPNWPYVGLATLAGLGYGFVFLKTQSVVASATVHAMIELLSKLFFRGSSCG